jgi:hypothetical protein
MKYYTSQITGEDENAVPVHKYIPHNGGRGSGLHFEVFLLKIFRISPQTFSFGSSSVQGLLL